MNRGKIKPFCDGTFEAEIISCWGGTKKSWTGFNTYQEAMHFLNSKGVVKRNVIHSTEDNDEV